MHESDEYKKLIKEISEVVGDSEEETEIFLDEIIDTRVDSDMIQSELLKKVYKGIDNLRETISETASSSDSANTEQQAKVEKAIVEVRDAVSQLKIEVPDNLEVFVKNQVSIPTEVSVKQPGWFKQINPALFVNPIIELLSQIRSKLSDIELRGPRDPKRAISVILSDGKDHYKAQMIAGGGGGGVPFKTAAGVSREALVDSDGNLQVEIVGGSSSGTEYTEGDIDASIAGVAVLAEGPSNTLTPLQVDATKHLQVDIAADSVGIGGGVQYTEGDTDASITGTALMWEDAADTLSPVNTSKPLPTSIYNTPGVQGAAAEDAAVSGNPVLTGGRYDATPRSLEDGDVGAFAMDADGAVHISDGGNSITVDGTVTANLGATDNQVLDDILVEAQSLTNPSSPATVYPYFWNGADFVGHTGDNANGLDVDVTRSALPTGASTLAEQQSQTTHLATIAGDTTSIQTAVEALDNAVDGNYLNVNMNIAGTDVIGGAGIITAQTQRVTIATDDEVNNLLGTIDADTSALAGTVSGSELQVDVLTMPTTTVQATNLDIRDLVAASDAVSVHGDVGIIDQLDLTNSNPAAVAIVDGNGDQITSFGGGTQYTEAATDASITGTAILWEDSGDTLRAVSSSKPLPVELISQPTQITRTEWFDGDVVDANFTGTALYVERDDALATVTPTEGQAIHLRGTAEGALWTQDFNSDAILADTTSIKTAVELIDDAIYVDDADWTDSTSKHVLVGGLYQSTPQTVTDGDVAPFQIDSNGVLKVNIVAGSSSGTEYTDADVDATPTGSVAMGTDGSNVYAVHTDTSGDLQVDVLSSALPTGASTAANQTTIIGHVDGIETLLGTIDADTSTLSGAVAGTEMQVDVVGALPAGTNAIGKLAANSGVDIGDVDVTSLPALAAGTNAIGKLLPPDIDVTTHTNYAKKYYTSAGAATDGIIWSPAAGKRWHVVALHIQVSAASTVTLEDDKAGGDEAIFKAEYAANGGEFLVFPEKYPLASGEDAADLIITTTAGNVYVTAVGYEI